MKTRREFIKLAAAGSGALVLGFRIGLGDETGEAGPFAPNAWVRIEPDGSIVIKVGKTEMGQGVRTALPMILAEELNADFQKVKLEQASPGLLFRSLGTGGSTSMMGMWYPMRHAGAAARTMLIAAAAERWSVPPESCRSAGSVVHHPASGRQVAYGDLVADAARQPVPQEPTLKKPAEYTLLGSSIRRMDAPDMVTGQAVYGLDFRLDGMKYAVIARPPVLDSEVESFDDAATKKLPGVLKVAQVTRGVAVIADNTWAALKGRAALKVQWTDSDAAGFNSLDHMTALEKATEAPGVTIRKDGTGRAGMAGAAKRMEAVYHYPFLAHAAIEPVNSTVLVEKGKCEIWSPTQTPNTLQFVASQVLGIPAFEVKVHVLLVGGGFGRRLGFDFDYEAVEVAKEMEGTPVHLVWTREDDMRHGHFQAASAHRMLAGLDASGNLAAFEHRKASTPHNIYRAPTEEQKNDPAAVIGWAWGVYDSPYAFKSAEMTYRAVDAPMPIGPWRAVFSPSSVFARECFIDEVAVATGRDPVELRLDLLGRNDESVPETFVANGDLIERPRMRQVLETLKKNGDLNRKLPKGHALGIAGNAYHTGTYVAYAVEVSLPFNVHKVSCVVDCGLVINPHGVRQQVEGGLIWALSNMKGQTTFKGGRAVQSNYSNFPITAFGETPPEIETFIVDGGADRPNGLGEPTVCPMIPAVANGLSRLTGSRIRSLPV